MKKNTLYLNRNFIIDKVDRRIFSSFLENGEMVNHLLYEPEHPTANEYGVRQDSLDLLKGLKVPLIRVGGNHNSSYNWKDGIGPQAEREPRFDCAWGAIDHNKIGLDEYDKIARELGAEIMPCVNLGTGTPMEAKEMVEYTNFKEGTQYSNLRIKHGHKDPYKYKVWCLGNELDGHWQMGYQPIEFYPVKAEQAARMMKMVDPEIEVSAVGSSQSGMPNFIDWEYKTLMQAPELFDYLSIHTYYGNHDDEIPDFLSQIIDLDTFIKGVVGVMESVEAKLRLDKKFYVSVDEWNVSRHATYPFPYHTYNEERLAIFPRYSMLDVLMVAMQLMTFINHADRVKIACISILTSLIWDRTTDYDVLKTATYYPFQLMNELSDGYALRQTLQTEYYSSKYYASVPMVDTASVLHENGDVTVFAVSKDTESPIELEIAASGFGNMKVTKHTLIRHADPFAVNSASDPFQIVPQDGEIPPEGTSVVLEPLSFHAITLSPAEKAQGVDFESLQEAGKPTQFISPITSQS